MIAAFLEWFLWLAAFLYCLVKVFQKAEHWTVKLLAILVALLFTAFRCGLRQLNIPSFALTDVAQMYILADHDRHTSAAGSDYPILPREDGLFLSMVWVLVLRGAFDRALALLCLPAGYPFPWTHEANKAGLG